MSTGKEKQEFGDLLRAFRESRGWTIEELAERGGVSWQQLGRIERGESDPAWSRVEDLAEALGIGIQELSRQEAAEGLSPAERAFVQRASEAMIAGLVKKKDEG